MGAEILSVRKTACSVDKYVSC